MPAETPAERLQALQKACKALTEGLNSENTQRAYRSDWRAFCQFCDSLGVSSMPASPETLALFVAHRLEGRKVSSVKRSVAAIGKYHRMFQHPSPATPAVQNLLLGARRLRKEGTNQVVPISIDQLRAMAEVLAPKDTDRATRNRALLLIGFASALRSANLAGLQFRDVEFTQRGVILHIRQSKTDQTGEGRLIGIPHGHGDTDPVGALRKWIERRGKWAGPLFSRLAYSRQDRPIRPERICDIVRQCVKLIGLDPRRFGSHSLRAGFCTEAGERDCGELLIAAQTGHRDIRVLRAYFRRGDVFKANASGCLGL